MNGILPYPEPVSRLDREKGTSHLFKTIRMLSQAGRTPEALGLLHDALCRQQLSAEKIDMAGRYLQREFLALNGETPPLRVLLLGQFTTSWLGTALTAVAWGHHVPVQISLGNHDNVLQDLAQLAAMKERPEVVVLLPWNQRLLGNGGLSQRERIEEELAYWRRSWALVADSPGARLLQVGYDWIIPGAVGSDLGGRPLGIVPLVRETNARLREGLPASSFYLDLEQVSGDMGRASFYDWRRYFWTKQPFSEQGACRLAEHLWAGIRALTTGPKKVLVVDLDNTLWGGVVGETGPLGITLGEGPDGEAYRAFQTYLKELTRQGVLLATASKNNPEDAREPFHNNSDMVLGLDDFAAFEASWEPKGIMIRRIADALNLGLDSFVYFDDSPQEREQVRQALPEVGVVEVPEEPAEFIRVLQAGLWFESTGLTEADLQRAQQYTVERKRREEQQAYHSLDEYLASLQMVAEVRSINEADTPRVVQLLAKTNQFNLTTRRHTRDELLTLLALPGAVGRTLRLKDRFGDYGLVAVMLGVPLEPLPRPLPPWGRGEGRGSALKTVRIDTWLMSCRVIGRTVEHFFFGAFLDCSRALGYQRIVGEFRASQKNSLVQRWYEDLGFQLLPQKEEGVAHYELMLDGADHPKTFVTERN